MEKYLQSLFLNIINKQQHKTIISALHLQNITNNWLLHMSCYFVHGDADNYILYKFV